MAGEYARVLRALDVPVVAVGRSPERAAAFAAAHGIECRPGGVAALADGELPARAIVATSHDQLAPVGAELARRGCRTLLLEKPGALFSATLTQLALDVERAGATAFVGYNRRFYRSVTAARRLIEADGGLLSASFDFTEIEARVLAERESGAATDATLARWGAVNSLHVIDLFLHLAGRPASWTPIRQGALPWHPTGAVFAGSGVTDRDVTFAYLSTWSGAGRWGLELTTGARKLLLRPLEELALQERGSFSIEAVALEPQDGLKEGLLAQVEAFLRAAAGDGVDERLCSLHEAAAQLEVAEAIFGYASEDVG
jgi:predicted dehydrogenase